MSAFNALVVLGNLIFILVCGTVGVRLVLKAQRTRQIPEFLLGTGLVLLVIGLPMLGASGMGRVTVGELKVPLIVAGLALFALSVVFQSAFVWRTFRPGRIWALTLTVILGVAGFWVMARILMAVFTSPVDVMSVDAVRESVLWLRIPFTAVYAWTAIEGFQQFLMARRREKIGIGDPVLTNRFLLWSGSGALACVNTIVSTILHILHMTPFNHPLGAACLGIGATLASLAMLLVFIPPTRYTRWLRARHGLAHS